MRINEVIIRTHLAQDLTDSVPSINIDDYWWYYFIDQNKYINQRLLSTILLLRKLMFKDVSELA